jgi:glyoxylase-like metal-dependent hydrolase (beta-lactamase superfamily II)
MTTETAKAEIPRTTLGDFELSILTDGTYWLDGGAMFGVIPKPMWNKKKAADERNRITLGLNSLLIRGGEKTVLVETGVGPKLGEKRQQIYGNQARLLQSFETSKVSPDEIDIVINTHLHFDHCGWNTYYDAQGRATATFPRATYYVQRGEWEHAQEQHDRDAVSYLSDNYNPLIDRGQMKLLEGDAQIAPGVRVKVFPGHTHHMQAVIIESRGKMACYVSDLIPTTSHLDPVWVMGYDLDPIACIDNRKKFYEKAIPEGWLVAFTHDHEHPFAYVEQDDRGKPVARYVE